MKSIKFARLGAFLVLMCATIMHAIVYKAVSLRKGNLRRIVLFDYHRDFEGLIRTQQEARNILDATRDLPALLLIEDSKEGAGTDNVLQEYNKRTDSRVQSQMRMRPTRKVVGSTAMWGLTVQARARGLRTKSLETRHPIGLYRTALYVDGDEAKGLNKRLALKVVWLLMNKVEIAVKDSINEIRRYNDGRTFNTIYAHSIKQATNLLNEFLNIKEALRILMRDKTAIPTQWMSDLSTTMLNLTTPLLDAHILHELAQQKNEPTIIVFAGGAHSQTIVNALQQEGFTIEYELETSPMPRTTADEMVRIDNSIDLQRFFSRLPQIVSPSSRAVQVQRAAQRVVSSRPQPAVPSRPQAPASARPGSRVAAPAVESSPQRAPIRIVNPTLRSKPHVVPASRPLPAPRASRPSPTPVQRPSRAPAASRPVSAGSWSQIRPAAVQAAVSKVLNERSRTQQPQPPIRRTPIRGR